MMRLTQKGNWKKTRDYLKRTSSNSSIKDMDRYGRLGVEALARATPKDTGITASSWKYRIISKGGKYSIEWYNTNTNNGENIAILIQYGHGNANGGYVRGRDYINPAMRPVFDQIVAAFWKEVTSWQKK
jgi:hypothetical protein